MTTIRCDRCTKDINESDPLVMVAVVNVPYRMTIGYDTLDFKMFNEIKKAHSQIDLCPDCCRDFDKFLKEKK